MPSHNAQDTRIDKESSNKADGLIAEEMKKKGRPRKPKGLVGQFGAGKDALSGIIDIALIQALNRGGEVKDIVCNYGMVIMDECHHVSAFSYEQVLKKTKAKYVYGLTATPTRKDGHHPILYMQCGPIRYRDDARKQAEKRPFDHYIVPRFTAFRLPFGKNDKDFIIQEIYSAAADHALRNQQIIQDVIDCHHKGRNSIVLTGRTAHVISAVTSRLDTQTTGNRVFTIFTFQGSDLKVGLFAIPIHP